MRRLKTGLLLLCATSLLNAPTAAQPIPPASQTTQTAPAVPPERLIIATRNVPPFAMPAEDGGWTGITIELWEEIAAQNGWECEYRETSLDEMIAGLQTSRYAAGVAALTMTAEREQIIDFTHPFYQSGLAIATHTSKKGSWWRAIRNFFTPDFFRAIGALAVLLLIVGVLVWFFERRRNRDQFGGTLLQGIGSGFWWSAVTMTTVGYGDKSPRTFLGRIVGLIWMFASIILISGMTAAIATALTLSQLGYEIKGPQDLRGQRVGTLANSTSAAYLRQRQISVAEFDSAEDALDALANGRVDAVVYDEPILRYRVHKRGDNKLRVLPEIFQSQNYAIALPPESPLREPLNQLVLEKTSGPSWQDLLYRYFGG